MAATADSSNHHPPRVPEFLGDGPSSPHQPRRTNLSSPWAQVVKGDPQPPTAACTRSPGVTPSADHTILSNCLSMKSTQSPMAVTDDSGDKSNAGRPKAVWNKASNGVIEAGAVMGAVSWPALSESSRASPKSSPDSCSKDIDVSLSTFQTPVIPLSTNKQPPSVNPNSTSNHAFPRQRSMKRGSGPSQSGFTQPPPPPPPPPFPVFQVPPNSYGTIMPRVADFSPRGSTWQARPIAGFIPQPHLVNDQQSSSRRGNYGLHGDGSQRNNFGGRHDHVRGNTRDARMPPPRGLPRGIVRLPPPLPPNTAPFITPQTMRPFLTPSIGFADGTSPLYYFPQLPTESFRGMPFIAAAPPPVPIPIPEPTIPGLILNQIEFYFSDANLITDDFLKSHMDSQGWVPITLIAGFPRVKGLTNNIQVILDSLRTSMAVEVQDEKLRRRSEWVKWIPKSGSLSTESGNGIMPASSFQKVTLSEEKSKHNGITSRGDTQPDASAERTSVDSSHQKQLPNGGDSVDNGV